MRNCVARPCTARRKRHQITPKTKAMKEYKVNIKKYYGSFSLYSEPLKVKAYTAAEAMEIARNYLWRWNCVDETPVNAELIA